ncbi:hypothetical protein [Vulcanisaeta sp. JCM 16161]|uniref:hypothetical protein n=1 Tax=Vulcanisaeta sp. JCM 16161 TaxID=1295372 RepID=UPI00406C7ACD
MSSKVISREGPGDAGAGRYGLVKTRVCLDDVVRNPGDDTVEVQLPTGEWVVEPGELYNIEERHGRAVLAGYEDGCLVLTRAVPREYLRGFEGYVIEWVDELPEKPIRVLNGARMVITRDGRGGLIVRVEDL